MKQRHPWITAFITAVIRSTTSLQDAPNTLLFDAVECALKSLLARTERGAHLVPAVQVDYQIDDRPLVRLQWITSADGKTASLQMNECRRGAFCSRYQKARN